jgi:hypothetical protein
MSNRYPSVWITKTADALTRLAEKPWTLFLLLLCVNTIAQPYAGINHDARLYSVQVLNYVEGGSYADDLFFRYGSQDDYSLFSRLAGPLVQTFGLPAAFFVIYLLSKSLLCWGMIRIVQTLVPNRLASTLALIYCMALTNRHGDLHMLPMQENFVTPRMLACALVLIGLDLLLRAWPIVSCLVILLAVGIHPLMAFGGLLIWAGFHLWKYLGVKAFIGISVGAGVASAIVLSVESLGIRCFGEMDDDWRQAIMYASPFNFPSLWSWRDWCVLAFQLVILGIVIWKYRFGDVDKFRLLIVLMLVTLAASVGSILAEQLPYALFFQGQPYRALWMLAFLHLAFAFWLCAEWSNDASLPGRLASCVLLAYLCCVNGIGTEFVFPILLFPLMAVALRGLDKEPHRPGWLIRSIQFSLVFGAIGWAAFKLIVLAKGFEQLLSEHTEYREVAEILLRNLGPIVLCVAACWFLVRFSAPRLVWYSLAAGCIGLQVFFFAVPETDFYCTHYTQYRADLQKVHAIVHRGRAISQPLPTVYCNLGCLDYVWLDLRAQCYLDWWQAGNYMFRRDMALEGQRRARLVGPCEIAHFRRTEPNMGEGAKAVIARFYQTDFKRGPLLANDLACLCQEPNLDFLVLDQHVDGLNAIQVGRLYVYSCQDIRAATGLPVVTTCGCVASCGG